MAKFVSILEYVRLVNQIKGPKTVSRTTIYNRVESGAMAAKRVKLPNDKHAYFIDAEIYSPELFEKKPQAGGNWKEEKKD